MNGEARASCRHKPGAGGGVSIENIVLACDHAHQAGIVPTTQEEILGNDPSSFWGYIPRLSPEANRELANRLPHRWVFTNHYDKRIGTPGNRLISTVRPVFPFKLIERIADVLDVLSSCKVAPVRWLLMYREANTFFIGSSVKFRGVHQPTEEDSIRSARQASMYGAHVVCAAAPASPEVQAKAG